MTAGEKRLRELKARDVMTDTLVMLEIEMTAREAGGLFKRSRITGAPVIDDVGHVVGILSVTDLMALDAGTDIRAKKASGHFHPADLVPSAMDEPQKDVAPWAERKVSEIMVTEFVSTASATPVSTIATLMLQKKIRRVLIIDNNRLVGIVTQTDILKVVAHEI